MIHNVRLRVNLSVLSTSLDLFITYLHEEHTVKGRRQHINLGFVRIEAGRESNLGPGILEGLLFRLGQIHFHLKPRKRLLKQLRLRKRLREANENPPVDVHLPNGLKLLFKQFVWTLCNCILRRFLAFIFLFADINRCFGLLQLF